jgi:hypothetical protein
MAAIAAANVVLSFNQITFRTGLSFSLGGTRIHYRKHCTGKVTVVSNSRATTALALDTHSSYWSVDSIERYTGMSRTKAKVAVQTLIVGRLLSKVRGGTRPRYLISPGHEIPPLLLSVEEQFAYDSIFKGKGQFRQARFQNAAETLAARKLVKAVSKRRYVPTRASAEPEQFGYQTRL